MCGSSLGFHSVRTFNCIYSTHMEEQKTEDEQAPLCKLWLSPDDASEEKPVMLYVEEANTERKPTWEERYIAEDSVGQVVSETIKLTTAFLEDHEEAVEETMDRMMEESIKAEIDSKNQAPTHASIPRTELTLALIKPDALAAHHDRAIRYAIHAHGFIIVYEGLVKFTKVRAAMFYDHHQNKPWFDRLTRYISSAPCYAFVLGKERAARSWNVVIGPTDPEQARKESPLSLRARFGKDILRNAVHGSVSSVRARYEIKLLFPHVVVDPVLDPPKARLYFDKNLKRTLVKALTALAKAKPYSEPLKVIRWFAKWLQEHNPNRPYVDGKRAVEIFIPD